MFWSSFSPWYHVSVKRHHSTKAADVTAMTERRALHKSIFFFTVVVIWSNCLSDSLLCVLLLAQCCVVDWGGGGGGYTRALVMLWNEVTAPQKRELLPFKCELYFGALEHFCGDFTRSPASCCSCTHYILQLPLKALCQVALLWSSKCAFNLSVPAIHFPLACFYKMWLWYS